MPQEEAWQVPAGPSVITGFPSAAPSRCSWRWRDSLEWHFRYEGPYHGDIPHNGILGVQQRQMPQDITQGGRDCATLSSTPALPRRCTYGHHSFSGPFWRQPSSSPFLKGEQPLKVRGVQNCTKTGYKLATYFGAVLSHTTLRAAAFFPFKAFRAAGNCIVAWFVAGNGLEKFLIFLRSKVLGSCLLESQTDFTFLNRCLTGNCESPHNCQILVKTSWGLAIDR